MATVLLPLCFCSSSKSSQLFTAYNQIHCVLMLWRWWLGGRKDIQPAKWPRNCISNQEMPPQWERYFNHNTSHKWQDTTYVSYHTFGLSNHQIIEQLPWKLLHYIRLMAFFPGQPG